MDNMKEKLDCIVSLHQPGFDEVVWENPSREELNNIFDHLKELNSKGRDIENFKVERHVKLFDFVKEFGEE